MKQDTTLYSIAVGRPNPRTGRRPVRFLVHEGEGDPTGPIGILDMTAFVARHYNLRRTKHDGAVHIDPHQVLHDQLHNKKNERPIPHTHITTLRGL